MRIVIGLIAMLAVLVLTAATCVLMYPLMAPGDRWIIWVGLAALALPFVCAPGLAWISNGDEREMARLAAEKGTDGTTH